MKFDKLNDILIGLTIIIFIITSCRDSAKIDRYNEMLNIILLNHEIELVCNACKVTECDNGILTCPTIKVCEVCQTYLRLAHEKWQERSFLEGTSWLKNDKWGMIYAEIKDRTMNKIEGMHGKL